MPDCKNSQAFFFVQKAFGNYSLATIDSFNMKK